MLSTHTPPTCVQPCYTWLDVPYYWAGLKAYDAVANVRALALSRFVTAAESLRRFPTLAAQRRDGATLKGTVRFRTLVVASLLPDVVVVMRRAHRRRRRRAAQRRRHSGKHRAHASQFGRMNFDVVSMHGCEGCCSSNVTRII